MKFLKKLFWKEILYMNLVGEYKVCMWYGKVISLPHKATIVYALFPFNYLIRFVIKAYFGILTFYFLKIRKKEVR
jgi:hypothetical protein